MCYFRASVMQLEFFIMFKAIQLNDFIMLIAFQSLKPWRVRRLKTWNTCCKYYQELKVLLQSFNDMRTNEAWIHTITCVLILTFAFQM
jgi:hypothetical protein